ncbi:hypothetical protein LCGC14_0209200 [marine sediment metagenome]|uniref:Sulfotransferase domain-containing protein n=1 Tax=marine sediment metagenome TaxID=412755 RepID=A0A0F9ULB9_9ZZZZ
MGKIFGIGLSRTATKGLSTALNSLGIKTIHYPEEYDTLKLLSNGVFKLPILEEYDAITDIQTVPFYPQLDEEYPNSKFIFTVRDIDSWLESTKKHFKGVEREERLVRDIKYSEVYWMRSAVYGTLVWDRSVFRQRYYTHHTAVMDYFEGRDNLLVLDICAGDGWNKLCPFLGVDTPNSRFPDNITAERLVKRAWRNRSK